MSKIFAKVNGLHKIFNTAENNLGELVYDISKLKDDVLANHNVNENTIFYIKTDEEDMNAWSKLALFYGYYDAIYEPEELKERQRKIEEHDNLRNGAHKVVEQVYDKPAIQYYNSGKFVCEFTYRWEAVKYFNERNLLTMVQVDKRIAIGNLIKNYL